MKYLLSVFFQISILICVHAQPTNWNNYTAPTQLYSAAFENNFLWVVSNGGIVKMDTASGLCSFYNSYNTILPCNNVCALAIDNSNNKWFGTGGGLVGTSEKIFPGGGLAKFDGVNWTLYTKTNSGLPHNTVRSLFADATGTIWAGTFGAGMSKFDGTTWTVYNRINSGLPSDTVTCIVDDLNGLKWIATFKGIASFDGTTWVKYNKGNSGLPSDTVRTITIGPNNEKWIGANRGMARLDSAGVWTTYTTATSGLPYKNVTAILPQPSGSVLIGTYGTSGVYGTGVTMFNGVSTWTTYNTSNSGLPKNNVPVIISDGLGNNWIGSERGHQHGGGTGQISKFDGVASWRTYPISNSGNISNYFYSISKESSGNLWFGGEKNGLTKFDGTTWTNYNTDNSAIADDDVIDVQFDNTGLVWFINDYSRLSKFNGTTFTMYLDPSGGFVNPNCLFIDTLDDKKWVGTNGNGISIFDGVSWTSIDSSNSGLPDNFVYSIVIDTSGNKWIGTRGGVAKFDGTTWTVYDMASSSLPDDKVNRIVIDEFQNKWFATDNGLAKFDDVSWTVYNTGSSSIISNIVYSITIDTNNTKWIGTDKGIAKFNDVSWTSIPLSIVPPQIIRDIDFDSDGTICIASSHRAIAFYYDTLSIITSIPHVIEKFEHTTIYPNPFSETATIELVSAEDLSGLDIVFFDQLGKEVPAYYSVNSVKEKLLVNVNSSGLEDGMYFYKICIANKQHVGKMIIKK